MAIEVRIRKEIKEYQEKIFWLPLRQGYRYCIGFDRDFTGQPT